MKNGDVCIFIVTYQKKGDKTKRKKLKVWIHQTGAGGEDRKNYVLKSEHVRKSGSQNEKSGSAHKSRTALFHPCLQFYLLIHDISIHDGTIECIDSDIAFFFGIFHVGIAVVPAKEVPDGDELVFSGILHEHFCQP